MERKRATRFVAAHDYVYFTNLRGFDFENDQIRIEVNGRVTVKKGFRSDGCSPTYKLPFSKFFQFGWIIGPPNGPRDPDTGLPVSARAFFLHDALLDNAKDFIPVNKIHAEFCREIKLTDWRWKNNACFFVEKFGPKK